jgi:hypothetical protein
MKNRSAITWIFLLPLLFTALFYACGDSESTTVTPASGSTINPGQKIVITFTETADKDTLEFDGTMFADGITGTWSKTNKEDDTLTLTPPVAWNSGNLNVDVKNKDGKAITQVVLEYTVKIEFDKFQKADVVIGQSNFTNNSFGLSSTKFNEPYANAGFYKNKLFLPDYSNNRVLIFNEIPTTNGKAANNVIGQNSLNDNLSGNDVDDIGGPVTVQSYQNKLFVLEYDNSRLLIYNTVPSGNKPEADVVIGQSDFGMSGTACTATGLNEPESFIVVDGKLIIADSGNNRVLIWNQIPTTNGKAADLVVGQNSFTTCFSNDDNQDGASDANPSQRTLDFPTGVWSDGTKLVIGDERNNRVLIWNTFPTSNFKKATLVLGQNSFTRNSANDDNQDGTPDATASSRTLNDPYVGITSNGTQLILTDSDNNRILIWNEFPTKNFARADVVLGQEDFSDTDDDATSKTFNYPAGLLLVGNQLIVSDVDNHRYLVFNGK